MNGKFTEEDKTKFIEFVNFVAKHARYPELDSGGVDTKFCLEYSKHLNFVQTVILKKIEENIFEITKIVDAEEMPPAVPSKD